MKKLVRVFGRLFVVFIVFLVVLLILSFIFQDKIIRKTVKEMNNSLQFPVYVDKIKFSLIRDFPNASVQLTNATVLSENNQAIKFSNDTVLHAKKLWVSLKLWPLINNKIHINKLTVNHAVINYQVSQKGLDNFTILKTFKQNDKSSKTNHGFLLQLQGIHFKNTRIIFNNQFKGTQIYLNLPSFKAEGELYKSNYKLQTNGAVFLEKFNLHNYSWTATQPTSLNFDLRVNNDTLNLDNGIFKTGNIQFNVLGSIITDNQLKTNIVIKGNKINITELVELLPLPLAAQSLNSKGWLNFHSTVNGVWSNTSNPSVHSRFSINSGQLSFNNHPAEFRDVNISGSFSNGLRRNAESTTIKVDNFSFYSDQSQSKGSFYLSDLTRPYVDFTSDLHLNLSDFSPFVEGFMEYKPTGKMNGKLAVSGFLNPEYKGMKAFLQLKRKGGFVLEGASIQLAQGLQAKNINGDIIINNQKINLLQWQGVIDDSPFSFTGEIWGMDDLIMNNNPTVKLLGNVLIEKVEYEHYTPLFKKGGSEGKKDVSLKANTTFSVGQFKYKNIKATNISGKMFYQDESLKLNDLNFYAFNGSIHGNAVLTTLPNKSQILHINTNTTQVNINNLFKGFNNFGQKQITHDNVYGLLDANLDGEIKIEDNEFKTGTLELLGHLSIKNGELRQLKVTSALARFTELDGLENLKFSTLENDIMINNGQLFLPKMNIYTNAFDISLYGKQSFNGDYEYHFQLLLADLLQGKARRLEKQQSEFGRIEDDPSGRKWLFLVATQKNGKSDIKFDRDELKKQRKQNRDEEKKELKKALQKEFGWFKKDSTLDKEKNKQPKFEIEWEED